MSGRAIVTGAGSGIGAATVRRLLAQGWRVACLDRNESAARAVAGDQPVIAVDVADEAAVAEAIAAAESALGGIDALATCAGIYDTTPFFDSTAETFRRVHAVNVTGTFLCVREAARRMRPGGRICTVGSVAGLRGGGLAGTAAYATSKGAVMALSKSAARELGPRGIAVNCVAPGMIDTPFAAVPLANPEIRMRIEGMTSLHRLGTAEEIAEVIAWLLSPAAAYLHGSTVVADGGMVMQ
ncbi:SDR family NAD(P)-dependent oxidoreductase [Pseudoroseomonas cervicalis]|uniref:Oxidoreductase, short chain dehydrogenase/reductase family protein n=1 Tax=Pseudoroseomonas cervicalis ATCC 49957 TaxID=525371 RepID=D5RN37_9PROT|nr:SDR family NAD(P)-dependent oxidoreductase [Pseudoroseomonas cervicalis]EFH11304.1 oxidoreductase, short chain dehydrogenase/reductase family protein [Pseudoroseomonas cervicalis ATCC 49957]